MLLVMASGLLVQVQNTPNVSPEMRKVAETTAINAISFASTIVAQNASTSPETALKSAEVVVPAPKPSTWVCTYDNNGKELACGG